MSRTRTSQGRNFALNPNQGLKIAPFKDAHTPRAMSDRELDKLARYLVHIATKYNDFSAINHKVSYVVRSSSAMSTSMFQELERYCASAGIIATLYMFTSLPFLCLYNAHPLRWL